MKTNPKIESLLQKYLDKQCTVVEVEALLYYFELDENEDALKTRILHYFESSDAQNDEFGHQALLNDLEANLLSHIRLNIRKPQIIKLRARIAAIAAVLLLTGLGIWFSIRQHPVEHPRQKMFGRNDIAPGKNTATLLLGNGKTIQLSDLKTGVIIDAHQLTYNDGTLAETGIKDKRLNAVWMTANTPRGGTYQFVLPDGTVVWLNAASRLKFPSTFARLADRRVELLNGEAYFEVAKDKKHPFVVVTAGQEVTVLGTHFNLNSYAENGRQATDQVLAKTTLLEGSIHVRALASLSKAGDVSGVVVLKPNQQAVLTGNSIRVKAVTASDVIDWKNGKFICDDTDLSELLEKIARWYDVEFIYQSDKITRDKFTGVLSRTDHISALLNRIELTGEVKFKIAGRKVYVY